MNERKYNHYIAWFNVNIKQLNVCEPIPAGHDYRISAPLDEVQPSVVDRLKLTAHRRNAAPPAAATDEQPEVILIKKEGHV